MNTAHYKRKMSDREDVVMLFAKAQLYLSLVTCGLCLPSAHVTAQEEISDAPTPTTTSSAAPSVGNLHTFEQRQQAMLEAVWQEYQTHEKQPTWKNVFLMADALFELGKVQEACRLANYGLDGLQPGNKINRWISGGNSGFAVWLGMDCYIRYELRLKARIAYEVTLTQLAPPYLRGHLATIAPRSYPDMESQRPWGIAALAWVYFGGVAPQDLAHQWALRAATSKFRLPEVVTTVGTDRSRPFEHRALFSGWSLSHYVTPKYVVYARSPKTALGNKQRYPFQGQSYPCGVMWEADPGLCSHFWITCPAADDNTSKKNCPSGLHTHGVTAHEQELLSKNALLWVFHIPQDFRNPYALGFVPGGALAVINDSQSAGRIYLHFGSVLIGLASSRPFDWNLHGGIQAPAGKPPTGSSEFRIIALDSAVALETAAPEEFPGNTPLAQLEKFKATLLRTTSIKLEPGDKPTGIYTDRSGNTLECAFDGPDNVNGKTVDYKHWPIIENPWRTQTGPDKLTVTDGQATRVYDFVNWKILDSK